MFFCFHFLKTWIRWFRVLFLYLSELSNSLRAIPLGFLAERRGEMTALRHPANRAHPVMDRNSWRRQQGAADTTLRLPAYTHENTAALAGGHNTF